MDEWKYIKSSTLVDDDIRKNNFHDLATPWRPPIDATDSEIFHEDCDPDIFIHQKDETNPTLIEMETCPEHVINVWDTISKSIVYNLVKEKGSQIPGLGTFTYCITSDTSVKGSQATKAFYYKKPQMVVSKFLARMANLTSSVDESVSSIPIIGLNMKEIASLLGLSQHIVDGVVTEVLQAFARAVVCAKNVEFPFAGIGKLQIVKNEVNFKFYTDFYISLNSDCNRNLLEQVLDEDSTIISGSMTPLRKHIPSPNFCSVFHLQEVKSVRDAVLPPLQFVKRMSKPQSTGSVTTARYHAKQTPKFSMQDLYGPKLQNYYAVSWTKATRDYTQPKPNPWPPHDYRVTEGEILMDMEDLHFVS